MRGVVLVEIRNAATVMLLRQDGAVMKVLMLKRNLNLEFVGGAYVFPGGKVDSGDYLPAILERCDGLDDQAASVNLGVDSGGLAYYVAAIREAFEEAGVLVGSKPDGSMPSKADLDSARERLLAGEADFQSILESLDIRLSVSELNYFAHWITPEGPPRRFDTRFFVARAPEGQVGQHDMSETVSSVWISPLDAIKAAHEHTLEIILPTMRNLMAIGRFSHVEEVIDAARSAQSVDLVVPKLIRDSDGLRILLPGDPGYDDGQPAHMAPGESLPLP
ncbi:MAG: NUDIX hydrolase [Acidimicrobiaceae bacterium]|nr:NUDIX hydrolase [Acidimicrobiaceae bacterium]